MSIANELNRITSAKGDIVTAIEAKGVDVPEGTTLDAMGALIEQIGMPETLSGWTVTQEGLSSGTPLGINMRGIIYLIGTSSEGVRYYHVQGYPGTSISGHSVLTASGNSRLQLNYPSSYGSLVYLRGTALTAQTMAEGHQMVIFIEGSSAHYPVICYDSATPGGSFSPPVSNTFQCLDFIIGFED